MLFRWSTLLGLLVLVILFIPIHRYTLPGSLPFDLEPYRVLVAVICLLWLAAILVDSAASGPAGAASRRPSSSSALRSSGP